MHRQKHSPADVPRAAGVRPLACIMALACGLAACAPPAPAPEPVPVATPEPARATRELVLLGTTDVHGRLVHHDYYTGTATDHGLSLLKPLIDSVRAANSGRVLLFDSGDLLQGNPLGLVYARQRAQEPSPIVHAMELLGYDASAIGNHEFNYGLPHLEKAIREADFPFVAANIFRHGTDRHAFRPYVLLAHPTPQGDTILIGVTGNTPPGVHVWDRANVEGVLEFRDVVASLAPLVAEMRTRGADVVVVLSHGGLEGTSYDTVTTGLPAENAAARLAREVPEIDVIFLGHTHRELADSTINGVLLTQARNWARSLAAVSVTLERAAHGEWDVVAKSGRILRPDPLRADTAFLDSLRWAHERTVAYVNSVVGGSTAPMSAARARAEDTAILDFVNEVQRRAAGADLSATAAFNTAASLPAGDVTVADVASLYIYDNTLKAVRVTGAQLKAYLEKSAEYFRGWPVPAGGGLINPEMPGYNFDVVSGADYEIDLTQPVGRRIRDLRVRGTAVTADQTFTLALNNYRQSGGGGYAMIAESPVVYDRQEDIRELLIEELGRRSTIRPEDYFVRNWRIVPAAAVSAIAAAEAPTAPAAPEADPERKRLRVLATNDFHGRLMPEVYRWSEGRPVGGAATLAAYFDAERAGFAGPVILLDGGDVMQGTPISNLSHGASTIDYYNAAGYAAAAIGNHEFDWGLPTLRARMEDSAFEWLAANIEVAGTDTAPSWARPTAMIDVDGVRVGVIGLASAETASDTKAENVAGLEFVPGTAAIDRWVPWLRAQGADFVIVVAHSGPDCTEDGSHCTGDIANWLRAANARPDLALAGHDHRRVATWINGVPLVESNSYGTRYSVIDLERVSADSVHRWIREQPTTYADRLPPDSAVAALVTRYERQIGPRVNAVIASLAAPLERRGDEYALGRLIADAQRAAAGAQVAIMNNGGIRSDLDAGPLTWSELYQLQPFENRLARFTLKGAQLLQLVENLLAAERLDVHFSGIVVRYDPSRPAGERVVALELTGGVPVTPEGGYTLAVTDFLATRGGEYAPLAGAARVDLDIVDLDALIRHLQSLPQPVDAPGDARLVRVGAPVPAGSAAQRRP